MITIVVDIMHILLSYSEADPKGEHGGRRLRSGEAPADRRDGQS